MFVLHAWYDQVPDEGQRRRLAGVGNALHGSRVNYHLGWLIQMPGVTERGPIPMPLQLVSAMIDQVTSCDRVHVLGPINGSPLAKAIIDGLDGSRLRPWGIRWDPERRAKAAQAAARDVITDGWALVESECLLDTVAEVTEQKRECHVEYTESSELWRIELGPGKAQRAGGHMDLHFLAGTAPKDHV